MMKRYPWKRRPYFGGGAIYVMEPGVPRGAAGATTQLPSPGLQLCRTTASTSARLRCDAVTHHAARSDVSNFVRWRSLTKA